VENAGLQQCSETPRHKTAWFYGVRTPNSSNGFQRNLRNNNRLEPHLRIEAKWPAKIVINRRQHSPIYAKAGYPQEALLSRHRNSGEIQREQFTEPVCLGTTPKRCYKNIDKI
jgi:hypothetical protein